MSQNDIAIARVAVLDAFDDLNASTRIFAQAFRETKDWPAQLDPALMEIGDPRLAALDLWTDYYYADDMSPRDTRRGMGLVAVPATVAAAAQALNLAKERFRSAVVGLKRLSEAAAEASLRELPVARRDPETARLFGRVQCARINLLQAYRKLVILPAETRKVAFTPAQGVVRRRLSPTEIEARLIECYGPGSPEHIAALQLPPGAATVETRAGARHWRANVLIGDRRRRQVKSHMPLLVVRDNPAEALPEHNLFELDRPRSSRRQRRDRRPVLASLTPGVLIVAETSE